MKPSLLTLGLLALALLAGSLASARPAGAAAIDVVSQQAQNRFPMGVNFSVFVISDAPLADVRLRYKLSPNFLANSSKATCTTTNNTGHNCTLVIGNTQASYMVPGTEIQYYWEIIDNAGATLETQELTTRYEDARFTWESVTVGRVTGFYYSGSESGMQSILQTANQTLDSVLKLVGGETSAQIKLWVYANTRDLQPATSGNRTPGHNLLGQVAADDTALMARDGLTLDTVRHEIAHIATRQAEARFITDFPLWMDEGLAMASQQQVEEGFKSALDLAIRRNRPLPIETLSASVRDGNSVNLFYAQSSSIISFMISNYGEDKFRDFFQGFRSDSLEGTLKRVYSLDLLGLENAWRRSVGLPPAETTTGSSGSAPSSQPTIVPFGSQGQGSAPTVVSGGAPPSGQSASNSDSSDGGSGTIVIVAALTAVLAVALLGAGVYFARKAG